jgi:Uma2 family endonuclease
MIVSSVHRFARSRRAVMKGLRPLTPSEELYPCWDPDDMPEGPLHLLVLVQLVGLLRHYYRRRPDVYVIGDLFWYYEEGNPKARKAPDVMVIKGVDPGAEYRRSFRSWEEKAIPCFILEILSETTAEEDRGEKRLLYERLGVREYFLFDPEGAYQERPLIGYRLIGGVYEELAVSGDGSLPSSELALRLRPEGERLALVELRTGERLPDLPETSSLLEEARRDLGRAQQVIEEERRLAAAAQQEAEQARQNAEQARQEAEQARQREEQEHQQAEQARREAEQARQREEQEHQQAELARQDAEQERRRTEEARREAEQERQRAAELAAEVARLRALLAPPEPPSDKGEAP